LLENDELQRQRKEMVAKMSDLNRKYKLEKEAA